jgi:MT-A70 protein
VNKALAIAPNYESARRALALCRRVDEVKAHHDKAAALKVYAKQARDSQLIGDATEILKRAEIRLGEVMAEAREAERLAKGTRGHGRPKIGGSQTDPPKTESSLADQGVDKHLADRARKAAALPPEERERMVAKAVRLAKATVEGNAAIIKEARAAAHVLKGARRAAHEAALAAKIQALPAKKYGVIYADPRWKFEFCSEKGATISSADNHYATSELKAIKAQDVPSIAADECVLFLWATMPMLAQALEVMMAWGFEYKSGAARAFGSAESMSFCYSERAARFLRLRLALSGHP